MSYEEGRTKHPTLYPVLTKTCFVLVMDDYWIIGFFEGSASFAGSRWPDAPRFPIAPRAAVGGTPSMAARGNHKRPAGLHTHKAARKIHQSQR
jgi:hypothetical protein